MGRHLKNKSPNEQMENLIAKERFTAKNMTLFLQKSIDKQQLICLCFPRMLLKLVASTRSI